MRRLVRLLVVLITCVLAWILVVPAAPAAAAPRVDDTSYAYDTQCNAFVSTGTTIERGPPASYDTSIAKKTAEDWPGAIEAANEGAIPPALSNIDVLTTLVHTDDVADSTAGCREPAEGLISALWPSCVAANIEGWIGTAGSAFRAPWILRCLGWSGPIGAAKSTAEVHGGVSGVSATFAERSSRTSCRARR